MASDAIWSPRLKGALARPSSQSRKADLKTHAPSSRLRLPTQTSAAQYRKTSLRPVLSPTRCFYSLMKCMSSLLQPFKGVIGANLLAESCGGASKAEADLFSCTRNGGLPLQGRHSVSLLAIARCQKPFFRALGACNQQLPPGMLRELGVSTPVGQETSRAQSLETFGGARGLRG